MPSLHEKIADSLERLRQAGNGDPDVLRTRDISRTDLDRLIKSGYLAHVMGGWVMVVDPATTKGDSTPFYANFWRFLARYCDDRFGEAWTLDPQSSIRLHVGDMSVPPQVVVTSPSGNNQVQAFAHGTSMFSLKGSPGPAESRDGLRIAPLGDALVHVSPTFFAMDRPAAVAALGAVGSSSEVLAPLLRGGHTVVAGRLAAAFRSLGRTRLADDVVSAMRAAGHNVREDDNPLADLPPGLAVTRRTAPVATRVKALWASMREEVIASFPQEPTAVEDMASYLADLDGRYVADAYHSLSIEGYRVTPELIEKVRKGWDPDSSKEDRGHADALAAKGYSDCFRSVRRGVEDILGGARLADVIGDRYVGWYRAMFGPSVEAGILPPDSLAGHRTWFIHLRGSRFVPVAHQSIDDAMEAYLECLDAEDDPRVAAVLGHFVFTYVHPFGDGNGRLGRFIMNLALASGGYPWTVVPVDERDNYLRCLDSASLAHDVKPFASMVADLVRREPPPPRRRERDEEPSYRPEGVRPPEP